ncbi:MBL fold metallo-hydrolase [Rhizobium cauense]|uniref:MBL fold metallo-hydrolase n=1 Tax=Rhizobium cauense TaxID=1166683 RepID=UPI001C6E975D|nr:MBL fold metallo-hydrolase [Rhizobium cauense]MBW9117678.1 MBL fold metallo-hydrolase [Rhizobium cauense]
MPQQIPLNSSNRSKEVDRDDDTREIVTDLAYLRTVMVNVIFFGLPNAGDRNWVLIDTGILGAKSAIKIAAEKRFGEGARPAAIVLTHGHFDHVGTLEGLLEEWKDTPVYAHPLEQPYLTGQAAYPEGDPTVGGGLMAKMSGLLPTHPIDVSANLHTLAEDGSLPAMPGWRWLHTPGHCPGHISLWRESDRTLIAGDAVITTAAESAYATAFQTPELHGPPKYFTIDWEQSRSSVRTLAALRPDLLIAGHGRAMSGAEMTKALSLLAENFDRVAVPEEGRYVSHPAKVSDGSAYVGK